MEGDGSATMQSGVKVLNVGDEEVQQGGVAIMISARAKKALMEWTPISKRIIKPRFYSKYKKLTVIQMYAPTNDAVDEEKYILQPATGHYLKLKQTRHNSADGRSKREDREQ